MVPDINYSKACNSMEMVDGMINIHTTTLSERPTLVDSLVQFHML